MALPSKKDNPNGLHQRYRLVSLDGRKVPKKGEYFVLRLDMEGRDPEHIKACRVAANTYANWIAHHLPQVAADIRARYPLVIGTDKLLEDAYSFLEMNKTGQLASGFVQDLLVRLLEAVQDLSRTDRRVPYKELTHTCNGCKWLTGAEGPKCVNCPLGTE